MKAVRVKCEYQNAKFVIEAFQQLGDAALMATARGLYRSANEIMTDSKANYVPFKHGTLRGSGYVPPPKIESKTKVVQHLGYGGAASAYALVQHERLDYKHPGGKQAKYLELPTIKHSPKISSNITLELSNALKAASRGRKR